MAGADFGAASAIADAAREEVGAGGVAGAELEAEVVVLQAAAGITATSWAVAGHILLPQRILVLRPPLHNLHELLPTQALLL